MLLLEQGLSQAKRAVLYTLHDHTDAFRGDLVCAISVPAYVSAATILRAVPVSQRHIEREHVLVRMHRMHLAFADIVPCPAGVNFLIALGRASSQGSLHDGLSLMQRHHTCRPESPQSHHHCDHVDEGEASSSEASGQDGACDAACPNCIRMSTWYIDHIRFPECDEPRILTFCSQSRDWPSVLQDHWPEKYAQDAAFRITLVFPQPLRPDTEPTPLQVIVEQGLQATNIPVLVSQEFHVPDVPAKKALSISQKTSTAQLRDRVFPDPSAVRDDQVATQYMVRTFYDRASRFIS